MDALIMSCGTGGGHNAAGHAVAEELLRRGHNVTVLNPYTLMGDRLPSVIDNTYISIAKRVPSLFGLIYGVGEAYRRLPIPSPVYLLNGKMKTCMERYLDEHHFDVILMSHLFPAEILTNMKRHGCRVPKTVFISTDYACIPFTEETDCDCYIVPVLELEEDYTRHGIPADKLYSLGIPVSRGFTYCEDKHDARRELGLDPKRRYILVAGGSMGSGRLGLVVDLLCRRYDEDDVGIIVICGSNRRLYERISSSYGERCLVLEHTDMMAKYMSACDLFITKPGGLSSSEAAASGTPLIHITPIPGCESLNMRFFESHGLSIAVSSPRRQLIASCDKLLERSAREQMTENQHNVIHATAASDICDLVEGFA